LRVKSAQSLLVALLLVIVAMPAMSDVIRFQEDPNTQDDSQIPELQVFGDFSPVERRGNLFLTTTELSLDTPYEDQVNLAPRQLLTKTLIEGKGDVYDFVFLFSTSPIKLSVGEFDATGLYWQIKNDVSGIGLPYEDQSEDWGSNGKLQGFIDLGQATAERLEPQSLAYRFLLETAMHEIMHRWSSYVRYVDHNMEVRSDLLGHMGSHWNSFVHSQGSVMYGHDWNELEDGSFRTGPIARRYSDLELYLAGFLDRGEVNPILRLRDASPYLGQFPRAGQVVEATKEFIGIERVIDHEGSRAPSVDQSQKHFRGAMVIVAKPNEQIPSGFLAALERLRRDIQDRFSFMTDGRAVLHIVPEPSLDASAGLPITLIGSEPSMSTFVDTEAALDWLEQAQREDGFWKDREGSRWRDSTIAIDVLGLLRPEASELALGTQALTAAEAPTLEAVAWRSLVLPEDSRDEHMIETVLAHQHADGGWGITDEHASNIEDTANILRSFWDVLPYESYTTALSFIAAASNSDGGWGHAPGARSSVSATLPALEALSLPVSEHSEELESGRAWLVSKHQTTGEFVYEGRTISAGDAARALELLFGHDIAGDLFDSTAQWLARSQGESGDWGGSTYATARALLALGKLDLPNLHIVGQPFSTPRSPTEGSLVRLTARIGNQGLQAALPSKVRWYDDDPRAGGQPLSALIDVPDLTPGSSVLVQSHVNTETLPPDAMLWVVVNEVGQINEWTQEDNYASLPLNLRAPSQQPDLDLHPDAVTLSPAAIGSIPTEVRVTGAIRNLGLTDVGSAALNLFDSGAIPPQRLAETDVEVSAQGQSAFELRFDYTGAQSGRLALIADPQERIDDADRGNNRLDLELAIVTGVDIAVKSIQLEPVGATYAGRPLTIATELANYGFAAAPSFPVQVQVADDSGTVVFSSEIMLSLDAQASTRRTFSWQPELPGNYTVSVVADSLDTLDDVDVTNNDLESQHPVTEANGINLRLDLFSISAEPSPALEHHPFSVSAVVYSDGGQVAPAFTMGLFDGDPRSGGRSISSATTSSPLAPGDSVKVVIELPALELRGPRTLWLVIDPTNEIDQTVVNDDLHAFDIEVLGLADLSVKITDLSLDPAVPVPGQSVTLQAQIENVGRQSAEQIQVDLLERGGAEVLIETQVIPELPAESVTMLSWSWTLSSDEALEALMVRVDGNNEIDEQDLSNNEAELSLGSTDAPFFASNPYFSPNDDGVKDETAFVFNLEQPESGLRIIVDSQDERVRVLDGLGPEPTSRGQITWDGRDDFGTLVHDGEYFIRLLSNQQVLATVIVEVDTNRSPLIEAQRAGRMFVNQISGYRPSEFDPIPVLDARLGADTIFVNPFSIELDAEQIGVYRTGLRVLEPVISSAWIQERSSELQGAAEIQNIVYDGISTLVVLAEIAAGYELWITDTHDLDDVEIWTLYDRQGTLELLQFGPDSRVHLYQRDSPNNINRFLALDPSSRIVEQTVDLEGFWRFGDRYAFLSSGVLVEIGDLVKYADFSGVDLVDVYPADSQSDLGHIEIETSRSGYYAAIFHQSENKVSVTLFHQPSMSVETVIDESRLSFAFPDQTCIRIIDEATQELRGTVHLRDSSFSLAWAPESDRLAVVDAAGQRLWLWSDSGLQHHPFPIGVERPYSDEIAIEAGGVLRRERVIPTIQPLRLSRETEQEGCFTGSWESEASDFAGVLWESNGKKLMFSLSDLIYATWSQAGTYLLPGESTLMEFDLRNGGFHRVDSRSLWPDEGQAGPRMVLDYGTKPESLSLVESFEMPVYYFWSQGNPYRWFDPAGGFQVTQIWPEEAGYSLVEKDCPYVPGLSWQYDRCLPFPVVNLDRASTLLQVVVGADDWDLGGFASDRNFDRWRIDVATNDGLDPWHQIAGWTASEVIDARFLRAPPVVNGPVLFRLEQVDRAGNRSESRTRRLLPLPIVEPPIELLNAQPRIISPNGDGVQDWLELSYLALRTEPFIFRVRNASGLTVFEQVISHLPDELGEQILQWTGESLSSGRVVDGDYEVDLSAYSLPVTVDTVPPTVQVISMQAPYLDRPRPPEGYNPVSPHGAALQLSVNEAMDWIAKLESRPINATLQAWAEHRTMQLSAGLSVADYVSREFRIRAIDAAGNQSLTPVAWPGDFVVLTGVYDDQQQRHPSLAQQRTFAPPQFNDPANREVSLREAGIVVDPERGLELEFADLTRAGLDRLSVQFRALGTTTWRDYELALSPGRNSRAILPTALLPGPDLELRLSDALSGIYSNIFQVTLDLIRAPQCFDPTEHALLFENLDPSLSNDDSTLVFWQAFSTPEFSTRELLRVRPGQAPERLEPVAIGSRGARLYRIADTSFDGETVVARIRRADGALIEDLVDLDCVRARLGAACFNDDRWFGATVPTFSPVTQSLVETLPFGTSNVYSSELVQVWDDQSTTIIEPLIDQDPAHRLYLLEAGVTYALRYQIRPEDSIRENTVGSDCLGDFVDLLTYPRLTNQESIGEVSVRVRPPVPLRPEVGFATIRIDLLAQDGSFSELLFEANQPELLLEGDPSCGTVSYYAKATKDLRDLTPGPYEFIVAATSDNGHVREKRLPLTIFSDAPTLTINQPENQATLCASESIRSGPPSFQLPLVMSVDQKRLSGVMLGLEGQPSVVQSEDRRRVDALGPVMDPTGFRRSGTGGCELILDSPFASISNLLSHRDLDAPPSSPIEIELGLPDSPQQWNGQLGLDFYTVDRAGKRSLEQRSVQIDTRIELEERAVAPAQPWSQRQTPVISLDGQASLRELRYRGLTHEMFDLEMRIYGASETEGGSLQPIEPPLFAAAPSAISGPAVPELSPAYFEWVWNGELEAGQAAPDGFYLFRPVFTDACRSAQPKGLLVEVDSSAPELSMIAPQPGQTIDTALLEVIGTVEDKYFESFQVYARSGPTSVSLADSDESVVTPDTLALGDVSLLSGPGEVVIEARDRVGNASTLPIPVIFAPPPPVIQSMSVLPQLFSPNDDGLLDATAISFRLDVSSSVRLDLVSEGGQIARSLLEGDNLEPGLHLVEWFGEDQGGNIVSDGRYRAKIRANPVADPTQLAEAGIGFVVDTTAPVFSFPDDEIEHISGDGYLEVGVDELHRQALSFELNNADGVVIQSAQIALSDSVETYGLVDLQALDEGSYGVEITATDRAENRSLEARKFTIDRTAPQIDLIEPATGRHLRPGETYQILGNIEDDNLLLWRIAVALDQDEPVWVSLFESDQQPTDAVLFEWPLEQADGNYLIRLQGSDRAGNQAEVIHSLTVDGTAPAAALLLPENDSWAGPRLDVTGTASDLHFSGYRIGMSRQLADGSSGAQTSLATAELAVTDGPLANVTPALMSGDYLLVLEAWDRAGNTTEVTRDIRFLGAFPEPPVDLQAEIFERQNVRLGWQSGDGVGSLAGFHVFRNGTRLTVSPIQDTAFIDSALPEGIYRYAVRAVDVAGNDSDPSEAVQVRVRLGLPEAAIVEPVQGQTLRGRYDIIGTASSDDVFASYELWAESPFGPPKLIMTSEYPVVNGKLATWDTRSYSEGTQLTLRLDVLDGHGNEASTAVIVSIDNRPPRAPTGLTAELVGGEKVALSWAAGSEVDLLGFLLYRNGDPVNWTGPVPEDLRPLALDSAAYLDESVPDGDHEYRVFAIDQVGNISPPSSPAEVDVDRRPPSLVIVEPLPDSKFDQSVRITAQGDDIDIAQVAFSYRAQGTFDWLPLGSAVTERPYRVIWQPESLALGHYELRALATDRGGLSDPVPPVVTVEYADLTPPEVPSGVRASVDGLSVDLTWNAVDDEDLAGYRIYRNQSLQTWPSIPESQYNDLVPWFDPEAFTDYDYRVSAIDESGNESARSGPVIARIYQPEILQPPTPTPVAESRVRGTSVVSGSLRGEVATDGQPLLIADTAVIADQEFEVVDIGLAEGRNVLSLWVEDAAGNRSVRSELPVVHALPPNAPSGFGALVQNDRIVADWDDPQDAELGGYRLFVNGLVRPSDQPAPDPLNVTASRDDPWRAFDDDGDTAWGDFYWHSEARRPHLELQLPSEALISAIELRWKDERYAIDFDLLAWSGEVWSPLARVRDNQNLLNRFNLDPSYHTDRLRLEIRRLTGFGSDRLGLAEFDIEVRPLLADSAYTTEVLPPGLYGAAVSAVDGRGFESDRTPALEVAIGDVTPPPPVVLNASVLDSDVALIWTATRSAKAMTYEVVRDGALIAEVPVPVGTSFTDIALPNGSYDYQVRVISEAGIASELSNTETVTVTVPLPPVPVGLSVTAPAIGEQILLNWQPGSGPLPESYRVNRSLDLAGPFLPMVETSDLTFLNEGLQNGLSYAYTVEALDIAGNSSGPSTPVVGTPARTLAPPAPEFYFPGMAGQRVRATQSPGILTGLAPPDSLVEVWRDNERVSETLSAGDFVLRDFNVSGVSNRYEDVVPNGRWLWISADDGDRVIDTFSGRIIGPWLQAASSASWDEANDQLWRSVAFGQYEVVDLETGVSSSLVTPLEQTRFASPAPDGMMVLLAGRQSGSEPQAVFLWNRVTDQLDLLGNLPFGDFDRDSATWSPDTRHLAWIQSDLVHMLEVASGTVQDFNTGAVVEDQRPRWSPDSQSIAVRADSPTTSELVVQVIDIDTGIVWETPELNGPQDWPQWSPDGSQLILINGEQIDVLAFPSGDVLHRFDFFASQLDVELIGSQRPLEMLVAREGANELAMLTVPGGFQIDDVHLLPGENELVGFAIDAEGLVSDASGPLVINLDEASLPDLAIVGADLIVDPASGEAGESRDLRATIHNLGGTATVATDALIIVEPPSGAAHSELISIPAIEPNERVELNSPLGQFDDPGLYQLQLEIDPLFRQQEFDRKNNLASRHFLVGLSNAPYIELSLKGDRLLPGQTLQAGIRVFNPGATLNGRLELLVYDGADVLVTELPMLPIENVPSGELWEHHLDWLPEALLAGGYQLRVRLSNHFGQVLVGAAIDFEIQLDAELILTLVPEQAVEFVGSTARLQIGVDLIASNGLVQNAMLELTAERSDGLVLERWTRELGTLLQGYQSREIVLWSLDGVPEGAHVLRLSLSSAALSRMAVNSLTVIESSGAAELQGSLSFVNAPLPLGEPALVDWQVVASSDGSGDMTQLRLRLISLPAGDPIEEVGLGTVADLPSEGSGRWVFNSPVIRAGDYAVVLEAQDFNLSGWTLLASQSATANDGTAPTISILRPDAGALESLPFVLEALISDSFSSVAEASYRLDLNQSWEPLQDSGLGSFIASVDTVSDGPYAIEVRAIDAAGNIAITSPLDLVVDGTPPQILVIGVSDGVALPEPVTPEILVSDTHLDRVEITLNGEAFESDSEIAEEGIYELAIHATDLAGNLAEQVIGFALDFTPPTVSFVMPGTDTVFLEGAIEVLILTDPGEQVRLTRGVFEAEQTANGEGLARFTDVPLQLGTNLLSAQARDQAGNVSETEERTVEWLANTEVLQATIVPDQPQIGVGAPVAGLIEMHNPAGQSLNDIEYRFRVWHISVPTPLSEWRGSIDVPAGSTETFGWSFASSGWPLGDLNLVLEVREVDDAWVEVDRRTVVLADIVGPELVLIEPLNGQIIPAESNAVVEVSDRDSAVTVVDWSLDGKSWQPMAPTSVGSERYEAALDLVKEGTYSLFIRALDAWGNETESGPVKFLLDTSAPLIAISGVSDGQVSANALTPVIEVSDINSFDSTVELNGQPFVSDTLIDAEGSYLLSVRAEDVAENASLREINFRIDQTAPDIIFTWPEPGSTIVLSTVSLSGLTEPGAEVTLNSAAASITTHANDEGVFAVPHWPLQIGLNVINARAVDLAGNAGLSIALEINFEPDQGIFSDRFEMIELVLGPIQWRAVPSLESQIDWTRDPVIELSGGRGE